MRRFALRKVRGGRVRIAGRWFAPDQPCKQLEGLWLAFGLYYDAGKLRDFVSLWGTKDVYQAAKGEDHLFHALYYEQLPILTDENGYFQCAWWRVV